MNESTNSMDLSLLRVIPEGMARKYQLYPIEFDKHGRLCIAMAQPDAYDIICELQIYTGFDIVPIYSTPENIQQRIRNYYRSKTSLDFRSSDNSNPIVRLVDDLIAVAIQSGASDIHIEPGERETRIRMRHDGRLKLMRSISRRLSPEIISRIKIMCSIDIAERRKPQDGGIRYENDGKTWDIRVSALPTDYGQKIVLRILDRSDVDHDLGSLGLSERDIKQIETCLVAPHGMILVTGPTGSGKTTTLYSLVNRLKSPSVNISTIEDPIEYRIDGITQTSVNSAINLNFSSALRALLRQDPDILLIGEIRDKETADLAVRASLTGHLVLSTLHTNDAPTAIARLIDLGVEPFLLSSALRLVIAQRLVRRVCPDCLGETSKKGCNLCNGSGYFKRTGIYECMPITEGIKEAICHGKANHEIKAIANSDGMQTLFDDGMNKVKMNLTTESEVRREAINI